MIRIVITGMGKERMAELVKATGEDTFETSITSDFEAALAIQQGNADYYIGACQSGSGAALGVAHAILGSSEVFRLANVPRDEEETAIRQALDDGKRAFGLSRAQLENVVPVLARAIAGTAHGQ
jgi:hypothetical protein